MRIVESLPASAQQQMHRDVQLLEKMGADSEPVLHFYEWEGPAITHGYFIDPAHYFILERVSEKGIQIAKRPTGGGIVLHTCDLAFSVILPVSHPWITAQPVESYRHVNRVVEKAVYAFLDKRELPELLCKEEVSSPYKDFCMAQPTRYDVLLKGKKIGGAAQRRTKQGLLHQGTLFLLQPDHTDLSEILQKGAGLAEAFQEASTPLLAATGELLDEGRVRLKKMLAEAFTSGTMATP